MKVHEIKIQYEYALEIFFQRKSFEIRLNDRKYQVGDVIRFTIVDKQDDGILNNHFFLNTYEITYLTDFAQKEGYVVFSIRMI